MSLSGRRTRGSPASIMARRAYMKLTVLAGRRNRVRARMTRAGARAARSCVGGNRGGTEMIEYRILGPVEVSADGRVVEIGGPRLCRLLAILLLRANEPVPARHPRPGPVGRSASPARRAASRCTSPGSARLSARPGWSPGPARTACRSVTISSTQSGSSGWSGRAGASSRRTSRDRPPRACARRFSSGAAPPSATSAASRSRWWRPGGWRSSGSARPKTGSKPTWPWAWHAHITGELEALVAVHPLRERLHGQLMLALYRGGRQAEALSAYRASRQMMVRELGLEPGPALQRLEGAILRQDPALDPPGPGRRDPCPRSASPRSASPRRAKPRRAAPPLDSATAIAAAGTGILAVGLIIGFRGPAAGQATLQGASGLVAVNTASDQLVHATKLAGAPGAVSGGSGSVWVADPSDGKVSRVVPRFGRRDRPDPGRGRPREHHQRRRGDLGGEHRGRHRHPDRPGHRGRDAGDPAPRDEPGRGRVRRRRAVGGRPGCPRAVRGRPRDRIAAPHAAAGPAAERARGGGRGALGGGVRQRDDREDRSGRWRGDRARARRHRTGRAGRAGRLALGRQQLGRDGLPGRSGRPGGNRHGPGREWAGRAGRQGRLGVGRQPVLGHSLADRPAP